MLFLCLIGNSKRSNVALVKKDHQIKLEKRGDSGSDIKVGSTAQQGIKKLKLW